MYMILCYAAYLLVSIVTTVWVAGALMRNGRTFLVDAFHGNTELADSVNHLLVVGFYLINIGYVVLTLHSSGQVVDARETLELLCDKLGWILLVLGAMHFMNFYVLTRLRKRGQAEARQIPLTTEA